MCWLTADWVHDRVRAAALRFPALYTMTKTRRSSRVTRPKLHLGFYGENPGIDLKVARLQAVVSGNPPPGREGAIRRPGTYSTGTAAHGGRVPTKPGMRRRSVTPGIHEPEHLGQEAAIAAVSGALVWRGAGEIAHPGGTLLAHLQRVGSLLDQWGA